MRPANPPAPPPPPPPLPPPPPPPPPPASGLPQHGGGLMDWGDRRRSRMRNFNWETLPKHSVIGKHNIWTADKTNGQYELDTDHMEELFSHNNGQPHPKGLNRSSVRGQLPSGSGGEMVTILSSKRSMNIGIFLKQFKRPVKDLIQDIQSGNGLSFGTGKLREMCKLLPDEAEMKQLVGFKGDPKALPEADLFMLMLIKMPSYEERLSCLVLKEELFALMNEIREFIGTLTSAGKELLECDNLHSVIHLVLKTGNYMNAGGYAGSAVGFRMSSLLKLADTKANKPGMNLMHYVVMQAQKVDVALLKFPEQLKHIEAAARITKGDIEAEIERQKKKVQVAKADTLKQEELKAQMEDFLKEADVCLEEIETDFEELQAVSDSVSEYFCEDPTTFRLEECCSIFQSFCQRFIRAMQENKAREMAEIKRKHIDRLQSAAKRRSTATCSSRDKEMEGIALEYVLQNVLTDRVSRRRSGKSSSNNGSPTRGSPVNGSLSEISSQKNLPTGTMNHRNTFRENNQFKKEWNSATELTQNFSQKQAQSHVEDNNSKNMATYEEKRKMFKREYFQDLTSQSKATPSPLPTIRSFSATSDDDEEEDLQDNNEEEAQKLREASKKVLQYQNSRGSTSSVDHSLENQKSPPARKNMARQLTFDEETQRYPGDPTDEDLIRFLIGPQSSTKRNLGRRNTLPTNVSKTQGEEENLQPQATAGSPDHPAQIKEPQPGQDVGHTPSKPAFDFTDTSIKIKQSHSLDQSSPSAEKKSKPNGSSGLLSEGGLQENQEQKSMEYTDSHQQTIVENILPRSVWFKTETSGSFFSFLRRLGDISKSPNSKETTPKGSDSSV
ncbi:FH2 domain-containing protein 1-like [Girardinichthys multiradiatus]|uniref:FH2 domain-containing protein 1-like n=1 Tax=Girardinichthys multiradiatus TaxID=208333 RepID=UPI001FACC646|nr:FH2 domain-containing protein 1-like [Girardinichthys multiradiatus]